MNATHLEFIFESLESAELSASDVLEVVIDRLEDQLELFKPHESFSRRQISEIISVLKEKNNSLRSFNL